MPKDGTHLSMTEWCGGRSVGSLPRAHRPTVCWRVTPRRTTVSTFSASKRKKRSLLATFVCMEYDLLIPHWGGSS